MAGGANHDARGYLLFGRDGGLVVPPFDAATLHISGHSIPVAARLGTVHGATNISDRRRAFTASADGLCTAKLARALPRDGVPTVESSTTSPLMAD